MKKTKGCSHSGEWQQEWWSDEILYKKQNQMMVVQLISVAAIVMPVDEVSLWTEMFISLVASIIGLKLSSWIAQEYTGTTV